MSDSIRASAHNQPLSINRPRYVEGRAGKRAWGRKKVWINYSETWVLVFVLPQTSTVILSKSTSLPGLSFPISEMGTTGPLFLLHRTCHMKEYTRNKGRSQPKATVTITTHIVHSGHPQTGHTVQWEQPWLRVLLRQ